MLDLARLTSVVVDGKYRIERLLGKGGMGAVFLAVHTGTTRPVALKLIIPKYAKDPAFIERFRREARAAGRMRHPNVVDVTDFGFAEIDGSPIAYLVMEYLDGCSLEEALVEDPILPLDWTVDVVDQMCFAIGELHRKGIVHRDLKPSNIWLEPNRRGNVTVKILDFGLAKLREPASAAAPEPPLARAAVVASEAPTIFGEGAEVEAEPPLEHVDTAVLGSTPLEAEPDLTRAGSVMGTPAYMAPEQCGGEPVGPGADIYSLGCIVYQMLSGEPPYVGNSAYMITQHMFGQPIPLEERNPNVPTKVSKVVMWALEKEAADRPATAELFAGSLRAKSESAGALVRRGLVLTLEHLPVFFNTTLALLAPYYVVLAATLVFEVLRHSGAIGPDVAATALQILFVADLFTVLLAAVLVRGVSLLIIAQILLTPLKQVRVALALTVLRRLLWPTLQGGAVWAVLFVAPTLLGIVSGRNAAAALEAGDRGTAAALAVAAVALIGAGFKGLCDTLQLAGVILAEGLGLRAALRRARDLARRTPVDTRLVVGVTIALTSLPVVLGQQLDALRTTFASAVVTMLVVSFYRHLVLMFMAVLSGVLYFKQREANAEAVESALDEQYGSERKASSLQRRLDLSLMSLRASGSKSGHSSADSDGPARPTSNRDGRA